MTILKIDYLVTIFFYISYQLVPKIEICLKYFLGKKSQKAAIVYSLLAAQLEGHDRVEGLLQGDGLQPELHVGEHGLSQPQKRPWTQKGSFPSSFGLF